MVCEGIRRKYGRIMITTYGLLLAAVVWETLGLSFLEKSDGLSRLFPVVISLCFYAAAFILGAHILKSMPVGIMYAVWCGAGIVLMGLIGFTLNKQALDVPALVGMALIASGVIVISLYSKSVVL